MPSFHYWEARKEPICLFNPVHNVRHSGYFAQIRTVFYAHGSCSIYYVFLFTHALQDYSFSILCTIAGTFWWLNTVYTSASFEGFVTGLNTAVTYEARYKIAAILQATFSSLFSWIKIVVPVSILADICFRGPINNKLSLVHIKDRPLLQKMVWWQWLGDKPLSEPLTTKFTDRSRNPRSLVWP